MIYSSQNKGLMGQIMNLNVGIISSSSILDIFSFFRMYNFKNKCKFDGYMGNKWSTLHKTKPNVKIRDTKRVDGEWYILDVVLISCRFFLLFFRIYVFRNKCTSIK